MGEDKQRSNTELWSGCDNIPAAFEAAGIPKDISLMRFLNMGRVIVKNDPALVKVFGQETVDRYEALLADLD